ncbi:hypothetical protein OsI_05152 [Oryza sativa Indica Group]|uniref:Uncharacterized protein n=1 Tax=Oryza sativa subsp. indica TaxID=39946 RepID=B8A937_ORYSI|nr:hypothetical protein OsI_05152 [Oryza sativa Indica Group]
MALLLAVFASILAGEVKVRTYQLVSNSLAQKPWTRIPLKDDSRN